MNPYLVKRKSIEQKDVKSPLVYQLYRPSKVLNEAFSKVLNRGYLVNNIFIDNRYRVEIAQAFMDNNRRYDM